MEALLELISNVKKLNRDNGFSEFFNGNWKHKTYVLDLNRLGQLYYKGIDASGLLLGHYAAYTLRTKEDPMLSHVTLKETGDFYSTFDLKVHKAHLEIEADTMKGNTDLMDEWGVDILGLTEESKEMLSNYMLDNGYAEIIKEKIQVNF